MAFTLLKPSLAALAAGTMLAPGALAQQFTFTNPLPSPKVWTEGVAAADVDQDGDHDLFFAEGDGFQSAGTQRQSRLVINQLEIAAGQFSDETATRLGVRLSNGKGVFTGDIQDDGWVDAFICNGFNTDPTFLYVNRGAAQPGFFDEEGAARGLGTPYSCASGQLGDLDNDGDLDLILCDSGNSFLGGAGDRPHLFFNDGAGNFTENAAKLNAPVKSAHMDVQLVDIDGDWDLDFFGANRSTNGGAAHYLMLNDGTGSFSDVSSLIPSTSGNVYEAEVSDLDNDGDVDMFFVSVSGFSEGAVFNQLADSGSLTFVKGANVGGADDNEVALLDFDNDGDLDAVIGSLANTEKMIINNGDGTYANSNTTIQTNGDSTLDVAICDLNGDGAYDIVTANGESNSSQFNNKVYVNTGAPDTLAPVIVRQESLVTPDTSGPWVVRAEIRDQIMEDGENFVTSSVSYRVDVGATTGTTVQGDALRSGVGMYRFEMADTAAGAGTTLVYELSFVDFNGNTTTSGEISVPLGPCGYSIYGVGASPANTLSLVGGIDGSVGGTAQVIVQNPLAGGTLVAFSRGQGSVPFLGGVALIDLVTFIDVALAVPSGPEAILNVLVPNNPALTGLEVDFQAFGGDVTQPMGFAFSNGVQLIICP